MSEEEKEQQELDVSELSEEEKKEIGYHFPLIWGIIFGVIALAMIACIIVIVNLPS